MSFWPGTNIVKSENNDFNWEGKTAALCKSFGRVDQGKTTQSKPNHSGVGMKKNLKKVAAIEKAAV